MYGDQHEHSNHCHGVDHDHHDHHDHHDDDHLAQGKGHSGNDVGHGKSFPFDEKPIKREKWNMHEQVTVMMMMMMMRVMNIIIMMIRRTS